MNTTRMRLIIDAVGNKHGGGVTVLLELVEAVSRVDIIESVEVLVSPAQCRRFSLAPRAGCTVTEIHVERAYRRVWWLLVGLDRFLRNREFDAYLGMNGYCGVGHGQKSIVFIQQSLPFCGEILRGATRRQRFKMWIIRWLMRRSARAARHVFVQNSEIRDKIALAFGIPGSRFSVFLPRAPSFPSPSYGAQRVKRLVDVGPGRSILYVGSDHPHKNLAVLREGMKHPKMPPDQICFLTVPKESIRGWGTCVALGMLDRAELHEAYLNAGIVVLPAFTETVGLPMLEAMRIGVPVLAADRPYARIICEDAAIFFDPLSPDDFVEKVVCLRQDRALRELVVRRGTTLVTRRDLSNIYENMTREIARVLRE